MLDRFNVCALCSEFIERRDDVWRDIEGHSFMLRSTPNGFEYHRHSPSNEETYHDTKYASLFTETLSLMADYGYDSDSIGDADSYGFYEYFPDYLAIVSYDSQGFVYSVTFQSFEEVEKAWLDIVKGYYDFLDVEEKEVESEREYAFGLSDFAEDIYYASDPYDY